MTPGANDLCVFAVKRGEMVARLDVFYWNHDFRRLDEKLTNCKYPVVKLQELVLEQGGVKDGPGGWLISKAEYVEHGIPMLRGVNVLSGDIDLSNVIYISEEKNRQLSASEVLPGDILITMRGTFGRAAIVPHSIPKANLNAAVCRIRLKDTSLSEYVMWYLNSQIAYKQFKRHGTKAVQDDLNLGYIKSLKVILPPADYRDKFVQNIKSTKLSNQAKTEQAEALLAGADDFTISTLNISTAAHGSRLCFAIPARDLDGVIDVKRYAMMKRDVSQLTVSDVCDVVDEKINAALLGEKVIDWIRIDDLPNRPLDIGKARTQPASEVNGSFFVVQAGDILVARLGPTILNQKIVMVRSAARVTIASSEFLVLRCKKGYDPEAVMAVLKTKYYRDLMYSHARGSTPSRYRLNREDMLKLPFPDIREKQEQIASHVANIREQVKAIHVQAGQEWKAAKEQFEKELLGEG